MRKKIVIIGGVAGGATAAARLRRISQEIEIIMFEKDEYIAFANCGLPYYIGDVITDRSKLLVQTVAGLSAQYNLDIRNNSLVTTINRELKVVSVVNQVTGDVYDESYDELIIATGAKPLVPNFKSMGDASNVFSLRNIPDMDLIKDYVNENPVKTAVVVGGGFIGIEMAENLNKLGIKVTIVDNSPHVLRPFDLEMAAFLELELKADGIDVMIEQMVDDVTNEAVVLKDGTVLESDLTIMAIGVVPNSELAVTSGLLVNERQQIIVDDRFKTSDPSIYAVGDVIETFSIIDGRKINVPLAWPANRQARLVADIIGGSNKKYSGVMGSSVIKVGELTGASTGYSAEFLRLNGIDFDAVHIHKQAHAGYYPGSSLLSLKLIFNKDTGQIYGAQAVGALGVEKRIDVIATAIRAKMDVCDLQDIEICYAPPFNSAKDPVNIAGYAASNIIDGTSRLVQFDELDALVKEGYKLVDVRTTQEYELNHIPGSVNIPLNDFSAEDVHEKMIIMCQVGLRGYVAQQKIKHLNLANVFNLSGGFYTYNTVMENKKSRVNIGNVVNEDVDVNNVEHYLDATGLQCPGPIMQTNQKMEELVDGDVLHIKVSDRGFCQDIDSWCNIHGNELISLERGLNNTYDVFIKKGASSCKLISSQVVEKENKGTIVMFSGDMDKALGAMIIAQGARAMGKEMTIFFTFWGLNLLRKDGVVEVEKSMFEKMFGRMMPKGAKKASISQMNMMGLGTKMIKGRMSDKHVDSLDKMIIDARDNGVKLVACTMSMDLMGIKEEELIDGVTFAGVASYVGDSTGADLTLFI